MSQVSRLKQSDLGLAAITETDAEFGKVRFETAVPVTFTFARNTVKAPYAGAQFAQDLEPAGKYMVHQEYATPLPKGWVLGTATFRQPIVLEGALEGGLLYGPMGWKARLSRAAGGRRRHALTKYLKSLGYDGIVTVTEMGGQRTTGEIVQLYL